MARTVSGLAASDFCGPAAPVLSVLAQSRGGAGLARGLRVARLSGPSLLATGRSATSLLAAGRSATSLPVRGGSALSLPAAARAATTLGAALGRACPVSTGDGSAARGPPSVGRTCRNSAL